VAISGLVMFFWLGASSCNAVVVALGVAMLYVERRKNKKTKTTNCTVLYCTVMCYTLKHRCTVQVVPWYAHAVGSVGC
jgi:hypothetical protein